MIYNPQLETFIQVGVSPMTPPQVFVELWPQIQKIIPVGWDYSIPFGLLYASEPSEKVKRRLKAMQKLKES